MRVGRGGGYMDEEKLRNEIEIAMKIAQSKQKTPEDIKLRTKIENAIIKQLKEKQVYKFAHYQDLVRDYMKFWDIKNMLQDDIEIKGVSVFWQNSETQSGYKKNDSISELLKVNTQMLKILFDLGVRASDLEVDEEDEEL